MADYYLQFSEILHSLTEEEEAWLRRQLERVCVFGDQEYPEDALPEGRRAEEADWTGYRMLRGWDRSDPDDVGFLGFHAQFIVDHDRPGGLFGQ